MEKELKQTLDYLNSAEALKTFSADAYWPKWDGPWWHMLLLHEMGLTKEIPEAAFEALIRRLDSIPVKFFPLRAEEVPAGVDFHRESFCHCQLGNMYQVLAEGGIDVDQRLPWIRPWFLKYQMADGGMNCDNDAYLVQGETPSSMVGFIAAFEAVLKYTPRKWTPEEKKFIDLGAKFLIDRKLTEGSNTKHNAAEQESAKKWKDLCFPRYYLYDVLRGLDALTLWSEKTGNPMPRQIVEPLMKELYIRNPGGKMKKTRHSYAGVGTRLQNENGEWTRSPKAALFPLLEKVSTLNEVSPYLTKQFENVDSRLT